MKKLGEKNKVLARKLIGKNWRWGGLIWGTILLGMVLRVHQADRYPVSQNDDGLFHVWAGNSILNDFMSPMSLSVFEKGNQALWWRSQYKEYEPMERFGFRLVRPWFDQPFLATLLIALPARWFGYTGFEQVPQMLVRLPALVAAIVTMGLTYWLGKELLGKRVGWWSLLVMAVWPLVVFSQRQAYLENFLSPVWLGGLLLVLKSRGVEKRINKLWLVLVALVSGWIKIIGFVVPVVMGFWLVKSNRLKELRWVGMATVISVVGYLTYGQLVGGEMFWQTLFNQSGRGTYLTSIFHLLAHPGTYEVLKDGWWWLAWMGVAMVGMGGKNEGRFLATNVVMWLLVVFVTSGPNNTSPWYWYPLYPLLSIGLGKGLADFVRKPNLLWGAWLLMLGMTGWEMAGLMPGSGWLRLGVVGVMGSLGMMEISRGRVWKRVGKVMAGALVMAMVVGNILAVKNYPEKKCGDGGCLEPTRVMIEN